MTDELVYATLRIQRKGAMGWVTLRFTETDLELDVAEFAKRYLTPALKQAVAETEYQLEIAAR